MVKFIFPLGSISAFVAAFLAVAFIQYCSALPNCGSPQFTVPILVDEYDRSCIETSSIKAALQTALLTMGGTGSCIDLKYLQVQGNFNNSAFTALENAFNTAPSTRPVVMVVSTSAEVTVAVDSFVRYRGVPHITLSSSAEFQGSGEYQSLVKAVAPDTALANATLAMFEKVSWSHLNVIAVDSQQNRAFVSSLTAMATRNEKLFKSRVPSSYFIPRLRDSNKAVVEKAIDDILDSMETHNSRIVALSADLQTAGLVLYRAYKKKMAGEGNGWQWVCGEWCQSTTVQLAAYDNRDAVARALAGAVGPISRYPVGNNYKDALQRAMQAVNCPGVPADWAVGVTEGDGGILGYYANIFVSLGYIFRKIGSMDASDLAPYKFSLGYRKFGFGSLDSENYLVGMTTFQTVLPYLFDYASIEYPLAVKSAGQVSTLFQDPQKNCVQNCLLDVVQWLTPSYQLTFNPWDLTWSTGTSSIPRDSAHFGLGTAALFFLATELFLAIGMIAAFRLHHFRLTTYLPENGIVLIFGLILGSIINSTDNQYFKDSAEFDQVVFTFILLPIIIFQSGLQVDKGFFFKNITTISLLAFIGTALSTVIVAYPILSYFNGNDSLQFTQYEALAFGALISAIDPVSVLSLFNELKVHPRLNSVVFGESVLNDAVAITFYRSFIKFATHPSGHPAPLIIGEFFKIAIASSLFGMACALVLSLMLKWSQVKNKNIAAIVFVLLSYASFQGAEALHLSGIVSSLFCGISCSHYTLKNFDESSHEASFKFFELLNMLADNLIFFMVGVGVPLSFKDADGAFFGLTLVLTLAARAANTFPLSFIANRFRKTKIGFNEQLVIFHSGLRGAIAYALALEFPTFIRNKVVACTSLIILFTTLLNGTSAQPMLKALKIQMGIKSKKFKGLSYEDKHAAIAAQSMNKRFGSLGSAIVRLDRFVLIPFFTVLPKPSTDANSAFADRSTEDITDDTMSNASVSEDQGSMMREVSIRGAAV